MIKIIILNIILISSVWSKDFAYENSGSLDLTVMAREDNLYNMTDFVINNDFYYKNVKFVIM